MGTEESPHEGADERWQLLKKRVVQHNIKVQHEICEICEKNKGCGVNDCPITICYYIKLYQTTICYDQVLLYILIHYHPCLSWNMGIYMLIILVIQWGYNQLINNMIFGQWLVRKLWSIGDIFNQWVNGNIIFIFVLIGDWLIHFEHLGHILHLYSIAGFWGYNHELILVLVMAIVNSFCWGWTSFGVKIGPVLFSILVLWDMYL